MWPKAEYLESKLLLLENAFDARSLESAAVHECWPEAVAYLQSVLGSDWSAIEPTLQSLCKSATTAQEQAFLLQFAISASEEKWDMKWRWHLLTYWNEIPGWESDPYCRFLRSYQDALSYYFQGALREAEARFLLAEQIANKYEYLRGQMRVSFHLGLIEKTRGAMKVAEKHFLNALRFAEGQKALRWQERARTQLVSVSEELHSGSLCQFESIKLEIIAALKARAFDKAHALIIQAELQRRQAKLHRRSKAAIIYRPLALFGLGRLALANRLLSKVRDPLTRLHLLELKKEIFGLSVEEAGNLNWTKEIMGITSVVIKQANELDFELAGVRLSLQDADVKKLMSIFVESNTTVNKEVIVESVWGLAYDPTTHDRKVYKLIQKAKSAFKRSDLFVNHYGAYGLNPELFGNKISA